MSKIPSETRYVSYVLYAHSVNLFCSKSFKDNVKMSDLMGTMQLGSKNVIYVSYWASYSEVTLTEIKVLFGPA